MTKESMEVREVERQELVVKYAAKHKTLREAGNYDTLQPLPKNASPMRLHSRCKPTGRPKGYMYTPGTSRVLSREAVNKGLIPGVKKASW